MTTSDESTVDRLALREVHTRKLSPPAGSHESSAECGDARTEPRFVGKRAPRGFARGGDAAQVDQPSAQERRGREHRASGKRIYVELESVGVLGAAASALVVDDVDGAVGPHDDKIHAPTQDDRPTRRVLDTEDEVDLPTELSATTGELLRIGPTEKALDARDDGAVLRMLCSNALCCESTARRARSIDAREGCCWYPLQDRVSKGSLEPCIETCRRGARGIGSSGAANMFGKAEHVNELEATRAVVEIGESRRRNRKRTPDGQDGSSPRAVTDGESERSVVATDDRRRNLHVLDGERGSFDGVRIAGDLLEDAERGGGNVTASLASAATNQEHRVSGTCDRHVRETLPLRPIASTRGGVRAGERRRLDDESRVVGRTDGDDVRPVSGAEGDARGPFFGARRRCPDLGHEHDWEVQPLARVHREQPHGIVVLRKSRSLGFGELLLGRIVKPLPKGSSIVVAIGDGEELSHVRDSLLSARKGREDLVEGASTHRLAEDCTRPESPRASRELREEGRGLSERGTVLGPDELGLRGNGPRVRRRKTVAGARQAKERLVVDAYPRPAEHREHREPIGGVDDETQKRREVADLSGTKEALSRYDIGDLSLGQREGNGIEHAVRAREDGNVAPASRVQLGADTERVVGDDSLDPIRNDERLLETRRRSSLWPDAKPGGAGDDCTRQRLEALRRDEKVLGGGDVHDLEQLRRRVAGTEPTRAEGVGKRKKLGDAAAIVAERAEVGERLPRLPRYAGENSECLTCGRAGKPDSDLRKHADVRPAKAVNGLLSITDHEKAPATNGRERRDLSSLACFRTCPEKLEKIALHARSILELIDEKGIDRPADLVGDVGPIAKKLASCAKDLAEADRGAASPGTFDLDLGRTEDVTNDGGVLREAVPHTEGSRKASSLFLVRRAPEGLAKNGEGLELRCLLPGRGDAAKGSGRSLDCCFISTIPCRDEIACGGLELGHRLQRARMVDERSDGTFEQLGITLRQCEVAGGAPILLELNEDAPQLNDEPIDSA